MPEDRYWLSFETCHPNPIRNAPFVRKKHLIGPFSTPQAARECWRNVYEGRAGNLNASVFYKEFDL